MAAGVSAADTFAQGTTLFPFPSRGAAAPPTHLPRQDPLVRIMTMRMHQFCGHALCRHGSSSGLESFAQNSGSGGGGPPRKRKFSP